MVGTSRPARWLGGLSAVAVGLLAAWVILGPSEPASEPAESLRAVPREGQPGATRPATTEAQRDARLPAEAPRSATAAGDPAGLPEDPSEPRGWHARADGPRWRALAAALEAEEHPLAPVAADLAERVAAAGPHLDAEAWRDLIQEETQLLGYLGTQELEPDADARIEELQGALRALEQRPPPG